MNLCLIPRFIYTLEAPRFSRVRLKSFSFLHVANLWCCICISEYPSLVTNSYMHEVANRHSPSKESHGCFALLVSFASSILYSKPLNTPLTLQHNPPPLQAHTEAVPILDNVFNVGGRLQMKSIKFSGLFILSSLSALKVGLNSEQSPHYV